MASREGTVDPIVVFLATGWNTSRGGVNAFNYDLCRAVARSVRARIWCVVNSATSAEIDEGTKKGVLKLTRFRGHLTMLGGAHDGKETKDVFGRVAAAVGSAGSVRPNAGGSWTGVRAIGAVD